LWCWYSSEPKAISRTGRQASNVHWLKSIGRPFARIVHTLMNVGTGHRLVKLSGPALSEDPPAVFFACSAADTIPSVKVSGSRKSFPPLSYTLNKGGGHVNFTVLRNKWWSAESTFQGRCYPIALHIIVLNTSLQSLWAWALWLRMQGWHNPKAPPWLAPCFRDLKSRSPTYTHDPVVRYHREHSGRMGFYQFINIQHSRDDRTTSSH